MTTRISQAEFAVVEGIFKRFNAESIIDYGGSVLDFKNISTGNFLVELPKVVGILADHKNDLNFDEFVKSLSLVSEILTEIINYMDILNDLEDFCQTLCDINMELQKTKYNAFSR